MQFTVEQGRAIHQLIKTARNKAKKSDWWRNTVEPLIREDGVNPALDTQLARAIGP